MIIPSIDLMNGKAVQLRQGQEKVLEREDVFELAKYFGRFGEVAVIDLDAALGKGNNIELIKELCTIVPCRVGGGIRSLEAAHEYLAAGAAKIIIGTRAEEKFLSQLPKERLIVAVDSKYGKVVSQGWKESSENTPVEMVKRFNQYCGGFLYTVVEKEGMLQGTDIPSIQEVLNASTVPVTAAGGISTEEEIKILDQLGVDCQLGMALYTHKINLENIFITLLDFQKNNDLMPTIVQDMVTKQVLMLACSNRESLLLALQSGKGIYYSRSRNEIWEKGKTSGNTQELIQVKTDCDRDALIFLIRQHGAGACHTGRYSCFQDKEFSWSSLYQKLFSRKETSGSTSYTATLLNNPELLNKKINEEAYEVLMANDKRNLTWEIADLFYFLNVKMIQNNIQPSDILHELSRRSK